ncbi:S8 family serine peptidase [Micromonospora sp. SL1-18]|uniref:S8 family serine peptidase n=1 Tax=Micromonospora sp. SL1-18 TaxID=3399128 RepID=UPI003A4DF1B4
MTRRPTPPNAQSRLGRPLSLLAAPALVVTLLTGAASPGAGADGPRAAPAGVVVSELPDLGVSPDSVTLITGDQVLLEPAEDGRTVAVVEPAPRPSGQEPQFEVLDKGDDLYVIPSDAAILIPDRLDRELFNVTKLAKYGYTDAVSVIVAGAATRAAAASTKGLAVTTRLSSVNGYAATVKPDGGWWSTIAPAAGGTARTLASAGKVWLDEIAEVSLDQSVPMIGAPAAWSQGFDGTGETVAVLDTGVDLNHPDLAGQIVGTRIFTGEASITDQHGHGTHVASTIAGTGAGSNGKYKGVAPGADLLIGKICTASGSCPTSATIAAMEWAAPLADVVSMSIGSNVGDSGASPEAMAINQLSASHPHTLFVVAVGNNGQQGAGSIASPGSADAALTVGAVDKQGKLAYFSGRGPRLGDSAIKPDVTAPGVGIVAARAAGTSMGTPVNTLYTSANGTSMATPHVSGAVAIAMQHNPELTAKQVKAELIATGRPSADASVYEQGGGLIDVPAAINAPVLATPEPLNVGFFAYPQDNTPVTAKPVTFTNHSDAAVTLDLALDVRHKDGTAAPSDALSVSPATLTIAAGGTATATVSLDVRNLPKGVYGGYLKAQGGAANVRVPVGFTVEPPMADLTLTGIMRDGRPATRASAVYVLNANDPKQPWKELRFENGVASGRFTPGTYYIVGAIQTMDGANRYMLNKTMIGAPTVRLTADTALTFDARQAKAISVDTPEHPEASPVDQMAKTVVGYGGPSSTENFAPQWIGKWIPTYVLKSGPAELKNLEFVQQVRLAAAPLELKMVSPRAEDVYIQPLSGTPEIDTSMDLDLAYVGQGAEADYTGLDTTGKAVLVRRSDTAYSTIEATARAHGAKALVIMHDTSGYFFGSVGANAQIPSMAINGEAGQQLRDELASGKVSVRVSGTSWSPYLYDLALIRSGALPDGVEETVHTDDLVTVNNAFHGEPGGALGEYRALWRPYLLFAASQLSTVKAARQRTEYVTAGTDSLYRQAVNAQYPSGGPLQERDVTYPGVEQVKHEWFRGPNHPTVLDPAGPRNPGYPVTRAGDVITLQLPEWSDSSRAEHYGSGGSTDTSPIKFYLDGNYVGQASRPMVKLTGLPPGESTARLELTTTRNQAWWQTSTKTVTNWTVRTARPSATALVPMLTVDYDTQLDRTNTAVLPRDRHGPATLDLHVRHQAGYIGGAIAGAKVSISYDDGVTWQERPTKVTPGAGNFQAILDSTAAGDTPTGYASVRVEAWDTNNNRIEQEITRAWRLAAR